MRLHQKIRRYQMLTHVPGAFLRGRMEGTIRRFAGLAPDFIPIVLMRGSDVSDFLTLSREQILHLNQLDRMRRQEVIRERANPAMRAARIAVAAREELNRQRELYARGTAAIERMRAAKRGGKSAVRKNSLRE